MNSSRDLQRSNCEVKIENSEVKQEQPKPHTEPTNNFCLDLKKDIKNHWLSCIFSSAAIVLSLTAIILIAIYIPRLSADIRDHTSKENAKPELVTRNPISAMNFDENITSTSQSLNNPAFLQPLNSMQNEVEVYPVGSLPTPPRVLLETLPPTLPENYTMGPFRTIVYNGKYYSFENENYGQSCDEYYRANLMARDGIYRLEYRNKIFDIYCFMKSDGGYMGILVRFDGSVSFDLGWNGYSIGFGNLLGEYFAGLSLINHLTINEPRKLRVEFKSNPNDWHAVYNHFRVYNASTFYALDIAKFDILHSSIKFNFMEYANGYPFSTVDADHDVCGCNCAADYGRGGWWFTNCHNINPTGYYSDSRGTSYGISINIGYYTRGTGVIFMIK